MKVLVTGDQGYVGSVLADFLLDHGIEVVGLDTGYFRECYLGALRERSHARIVLDLRDVRADHLDGCEAVLHLAALCNDPLARLAPERTMEINHAASVRLASEARAAGVARFVYASSCSLYGAADQGWVREEAPFEPVTAYGESKAQAERDIARLADGRFCPTFLRFGTGYGVSPRLRFDVVLNNLVGWAHTTGKVRLLSDGQAWRPLIHVEDMCRAYLAVLEAPREVVWNRTFNVGVDGENYRIADLAEIVRRTVPGTAIEYAPGAGRDTRNYRVSFDRIAAALPGFKPRWTAEAGAQEVYAAIRRAGVTYDAFQGRLYTRLGQIEHLLRAGQLDTDLRWTSGEASAA